MNYLITLLLTVGFCTGARAQSHDTLALRAYLTSDLATWQRALAATDQVADAKTRLLLRAEYNLALAYASMGREEDEDVRDAAIDDMDDALDNYWKLDEESAAAHGLYSALLGLKIARKPMTGMLYGSRAGSYAEDAVALDSNDPTALHHAAANLYYTPEQWGGNPQLALEYLQKAGQQYGEGHHNNWRYLATLALRGQVEAKLGMTEVARATYAEALEAQPDFAYVSRVLLPQLK